MRYLTWLLLAFLIAGHLLVDFIVPVLFFRGDDGQWLLAATLGLCIGQINLIGVWAAMAPGRVMLRLPWTIFLTTLMWYALILGNRMRIYLAEFEHYYIYGGTFELGTALQLGLILLCAVLLVQIPLWGASRLLRWRLFPATQDVGDTHDERQFNIKHLIVGMVVSAIAFGLGRVVMPPGDLKVEGLDNELTVLLPAVAVVNLIVVLPCIWGAFVDWVYLAPLASLWLVYAVVVSVVETFVLILALGVPGNGAIWGLMIVFNVMQCVCVLVTLVGLRLIGFRLQRIPGRSVQLSIQKAGPENSGGKNV